MYSLIEQDDRVAIVQMNAELRHTHLELLSAQYATDRLRTRYSAEDLARHSEQDVLHKAIRTAVTLRDHFVSIQEKVSKESASLRESLQAATRLADYLRTQRDTYFRTGVSLTEQQKQILQPFFSSAILDRVRVVELRGQRLPTPPFYAEAEKLGFVNLPAVTHMAALTFVDVIVFNDPIVERTLFHGLVHAVQFDILGLEYYSDLFVSAFFRSNAHFNVPLEMQAFALESKFAANPESPFSVEEQVRLWSRDQRYR